MTPSKDIQTAVVKAQSDVSTTASKLGAEQQNDFQNIGDYFAASFNKESKTRFGKGYEVFGQMIKGAPELNSVSVKISHKIQGNKFAILILISPKTPGAEELVHEFEVLKTLGYAMSPRGSSLTFSKYFNLSPSQTPKTKEKTEGYPIPGPFVMGKLQKNPNLALELIAKTGLTKEELLAFISGRAYPTDELAINIANVIKVNPDVFLAAVHEHKAKTPESQIIG